MSLLILSAADVNAIVDAIAPQQVMDLMRQVFVDLSRSSSAPPGSSSPLLQSPHRTSIHNPQHTTLFMPSRWQTSTAIKIVSVPTSDGTTGLPATTVVMDESTGRVKAIVNARSLTALRTAAGSALATSLAFKRMEPKHVCFFGAGLQIRFHARMVLHHEMYGTSVTRATVVNRSRNETMEGLLRELRDAFPEVDVRGVISGEKTLVQEAVETADIICAATSSTTPLFDSAWVKSGTHVNLVGSYTPQMREVDDTLVTERAKVILVDSRAVCMQEAGDLIQAGFGRVPGSEVEKKVVEVGEFVMQGAEGSKESLAVKGDISIFKTVGVGVQDVAIAALVVKLAEERGIGIRVPFE